VYDVDIRCHVRDDLECANAASAALKS